jgi:5-methylcytosine-specific restriction endonuclease McrA
MTARTATSWSGDRRSFPTRLRLAILHRDPICRCTGCRHHTGRCTSPSTIADHIVPIAEGGADDPSNGQGLCAPCHDLKTRAEMARGRARTSKASRLRTPEPHPGRIRRQP